MVSIKLSLPINDCEYILLTRGYIGLWLFSIEHLRNMLVVFNWYTLLTERLGMMTSSNGNIFRVTDHLCGEFIGNRWILGTKASGAELWCFNRLIKQSWGRWFKTPSWSLWHHCNGNARSIPTSIRDFCSLHIEIERRRYSFHCVML